MRKRIRTKNKRVKKNIKDNGFKKIFGDKQLFCEFIKSFINIEILKDIKPSDVEDISGRFINIYKENRDSDTVKYNVPYKVDKIRVRDLSILDVSE